MSIVVEENPVVEVTEPGEERAPASEISSENTDIASNAAAAQIVRERFAEHGFELTEEVQWAELPGAVLEALRDALPAQAAPRISEEEHRQQLAERIARSQRLPRGTRQRLANMLQAVRFDDTGRDEPALRVSDAIALLEETLPAHLLLTPDELPTAGHPRGEGFFSGDARSLSDDDARRIAAEQLARTGYKRS